MKPCFYLQFFFILLLSLGRSVSHAQIPAPPPPPQPRTNARPTSALEASAAESRLRQTETIYQQQLRAKHIPILGKYLTELQKIALSANDPAPIKAEIQRIQAIISSGAVMDLAAVAEELNPSSTKPKVTGAGPPPPPGPPMKLKKGITPLTPAFAQSIQPVPEGSASPEAAAIGQIEWRIDHLPPGTYELIIQYSAPDLETDLPLSIDFAGQKISHIMDKNRATKDLKSYRLFRLGEITLAKEFAGETLRLTAGTATNNTLLLRNLIITRARP